MKVLIVNDDSISAPGIAMLAKAAAELGEVWVVAPKHQCSAMSQKLTIHGDMLLEKAVDFPVQGVKAYCLEGTPVDCVKVALQHLMQEKPDFVFSGINNGYNTGYDIVAIVNALWEQPLRRFGAACLPLHFRRQGMPTFPARKAICRS